jgi:type I restriction enzyme S subunit
LYYLFTKEDLNKYKAQGAQPGLSVSNLNNIEFAIPSMEEQERIVSILDRFETLTNDLQNGLPAEIEARRQQYEYYRNKLLTFDKIA